MNSDNSSSLPTTRCYVPPYRSYAMKFDKAIDHDPLFSGGVASEGGAPFSAKDRQGLFLGKRSGHHNAGAFSPYVGNGASPAPSVVSSEYSVSPFPFDAPSPIPNSGSNVLEPNQNYGSEFFATPRMQENVHTTFSPPSRQYFFTPVEAANHEILIDTPSKDLNLGSPYASESNSHHAVIPQCRPVSTGQVSPRGFVPICRPVSTDSEPTEGRNTPFTGSFEGNIAMPHSNLHVESKLQASLQVPLSSLGEAKLPTDSSYLSTAMRGNHRSHYDGLNSPLYRRNSSDSTSNWARRPGLELPCPKSPANTTITTGMPSPRVSPLPQNLKGDPHRQAKVKTELCLNFSRGLRCQFGPRCNYAHGEHELKYTKLFELNRAGLVTDIGAYRAFPCFSWVATGACPFGLRCVNLHDPRVAGTKSSWLPHCDIPVSSLQTDLVVDKTHHKLLSELSQINPLVQNLLWNFRPSLKKTASNSADTATENQAEDSEWRDTYSLVCNLANLNPAKSQKPITYSKVKISELQRLCIAVQMARGSESKRHFIYKPRHLVYNELCMVLRTKYFRFLLPKNLPGSIKLADAPRIESIVSEITQEEYQTAASFWARGRSDSSDDVIVVHELAFGCAGEPSSRVSLWFGLNDMKELTPQEIKRLKRNKQRNRSAINNEPQETMPYPGSDRIVSNFNRDRLASSRTSRTPSSFDTHPHKPFFYMDPCLEIEASQLIEALIYHRITVLFHREYRAYAGTDAEIRAFITAKDFELKGSFENLKKAVTRSKWPVSKGRETITAESPVPKCGSTYIPAEPNEAKSVWDEFLSSAKAGFTEETLKEDPEQTKTRLPIFCRLARNKGAGKTGVMIPHLTQGLKEKGSDDSWKSILLDTKDGWAVIKSHYLGSNEQNKDKCMPLSPAAGDRVVSQRI